MKNMLVNFVDLISLALLTDGSISKVLLNLGVHSNQRISFSMSNTGEGSLQNRGKYVKLISSLQDKLKKHVRLLKKTVLFSRLECEFKRFPHNL